MTYYNKLKYKTPINIYETLNWIVLAVKSDDIFRYKYEPNENIPVHRISRSRIVGRQRTWDYTI